MRLLTRCAPSFFLGLAAVALLALSSPAAEPAPTPAGAPASVPAPDAPFSAPRLDAWKIIGPGGGGAQFYPTISPLDPNKVLIRCDMTGAYLSENGGQSWRMFNGRTTVSFFVFDPVDPNVIYCNRLGLIRSADGGKTWTLVHPDPANVKGVVISDDHAGESIATKDGSSERVLALAVDPADSKTLYIAGSSGGAVACYVSADWGKTWKKSGDLSADARSIYIDPKSPLDRTRPANRGRQSSRRRPHPDDGGARHQVGSEPPSD